jgi:hypothetical protein
MTTGDLNDPLLRQVLPVTDEFVFTPGFARGPLAEQDCNQPGLLHKYAIRVGAIREKTTFGQMGRKAAVSMILGIFFSK